MADLRRELLAAFSRVANPYEAVGPLAGLLETRRLPSFEEGALVFRGGSPKALGHSVVISDEPVAGVSPEDQLRHELRHVRQSEALGPLAAALTFALGVVPRELRPTERDATSHELRMSPEGRRAYQEGSPFFSLPLERYFERMLGE